MEFNSTITGHGTENILWKFIDSLKQKLGSKERELQKCNADLQNKQTELSLASHKIEDQKREIETLTTLVLEENTGDSKNMEEINKLREHNRQLIIVKDTFAEFLTRLGIQFNFEGCDRADLANKLLQKINEKIRSYENESPGTLQQGIEPVAQATTSAAARTSTDAQKEGSILLNQLGSCMAAKSMSSALRPTSSSSLQLATKQKKQRINKKISTTKKSFVSKGKKCRKDPNFNSSYGYRCMCGKLLKGEQSLIRHIGQSVKNLQFYCSTCNKAFSNKSKLTRHLKSVKCIKAKLLQKMFGVGDNTVPTSQPKYPKFESGTSGTTISEFLKKLFDPNPSSSQVLKI